MEKKLLPYLVIISALSVSLSAAFYSVTGLSKMFSGASLQVMIMMSSLEIAKLVLASLLYQYWGKLNKALKFYYFVALFVLMAITSAGIYGYLSSAYSETSNKVENIDKQVKVLDTKREMFQVQLNDVRSEKERISSNISELTKAVSNNFIQTKDKTGNIITTTSSANRKVYEEQLKSSQKRRDDILLSETNLNDSITKMDLKKLDLETNSDIAGEVGPLKYISKLTGKSIDQVINWFIIALMLVFDPLAVSLVIGANVIFRDKRKEEEKLKLSKEIDGKIKDFKIKEKEFENKSLKIKDDEIKSLEKVSEREKEIIEKEKEVLDLENQFKIKADQINSSFKTKENIFESYVQEEKSKLEKNKQELELFEKELNLKTDNYRELILKEEEQYKLKLEEQKNKLENDSHILKKERKEFNDFKKKILEDKEDLDSLSIKLKDKEEELKDKEDKLEKIKEELENIDSEIKAWEAQNFKMKRMNKPPSAI